MKKPRQIIYAIDASPLYRLMLRESIRSLRDHDDTTPVLVALLGDIPDEEAAWLEAQGIELREGDSVEPEERASMKWNALPLADASQVLLIDVDTLWAGSPDRLFTAYAEPHLCARREIGTLADEVESIGTARAERQIDPLGMARLRAELGAGEVPVFNCGVMVYNHGAHLRVGEARHEIFEMARRFRSGELPYPCSNLHIADEIAAAIVLGTIPGLTFDLISPADSPWYYELKYGAVKDMGVVLHIWTMYYKNFLKKFRPDDLPCFYRSLLAQRDFESRKAAERLTPE